MNWETSFVFALVVIAGAAMASGRVRMDMTAFLVVIALGLSGILTPGEALAGFSDPVVLTIAGLLVVGEGLARTGIAATIGSWVTFIAGRNENRVLLLLMVAGAFLSSIMSSTAVVAIFIPVAINIAQTTGMSRARILLPLAYAVIIGGMMTLLATAPNLVVSGALDKAEFEPFAFFAFTPIGAAVLVIAIVYALWLGRRLFPGGAHDGREASAVSIRQLARRYGLAGGLYRLEVHDRSLIIGSTLAESGLGSRYGVRVLGVERTEAFIARVIGAPSAQLKIREGDVLIVQAHGPDFARCVDELELEVQPMQDRHGRLMVRDVGIAEVLISPESSLKGKTLRERKFRSRHQIEVIGLRRAGDVVEAYLDERLRPGDTLLVAGPWVRIQHLHEDLGDFVVLTMPRELQVMAPARKRAPIAVVAVTAMVVVTVLDVVPVVLIVMTTAIVLILTRCLTMQDAYRAMHWSAVFLIAGMLPIADALQKTGGVDLIVGQLVGGLGEHGPWVMTAGLFLVTAVLGSLLSSSPTAVLMAPVAISIANAMDISPYPLAMAVAIAASAAYVSPISSPVGTLVMEPGGYRYLDFVKAGVPLLLLTWAVAVALIPLLFPF
ncbi:MAG: SLC13 family permease [Holophagae bacterium]